MSRSNITLVEDGLVKYSLRDTEKRRRQRVQGTLCELKRE